jgi:hypothetical protein
MGVSWSNDKEALIKAFISYAASKTGELQAVIDEQNKKGEGFASAIVEKKNGVDGLYLYINGKPYGHYATSENRFEEAMTAALSDAKEYGYEGIIFCT